MRNAWGNPPVPGCIQVSNEDAIDLSTQISAGTHLYISLN